MKLHKLDGRRNLESELLPEQMLGSDLWRGGIFLIEACTAKDHDLSFLSGV